jgi:hypothetical protein
MKWVGGDSISAESEECDPVSCTIWDVSPFPPSHNYIHSTSVQMFVLKQNGLECFPNLNFVVVVYFGGLDPVFIYIPPISFYVFAFGMRQRSCRPQAPFPFLFVISSPGGLILRDIAKKVAHGTLTS